MIVRCEKHAPKRYSHTVNPVGYPNTAAVCGKYPCEDAGKLLLTEAEWGTISAALESLGGLNRIQSE